MPKPAAEPHEWFSIVDPDGTTWLFDITFLTSNWTCIFGRGCPGIHDEPHPELEQGCCTYGAHLADKADRQRVDRWLEESQYLIGRLIPGFLDDRERLKAKMDSAEQDAERLRAEAAELRKEVAALQSEVQYYRAEQAAAADALAGIMDHLSQLQKPASDLYRRLQSSSHTPSSEVHA